MKTQYDRIGKLLQRQRGATGMEICQIAGTVSPHRRMFEMRRAGWIITRKPVKGQSYGRYYGVAPDFGVTPGCYFTLAGERDRKAAR